MGEDLDNAIKVGLGIFGGFILLNILFPEIKCKVCGRNFPSGKERCPHCGARK